MSSRIDSKYTVWLFLPILVALPLSSASADVYKCLTAAGKVEFQDKPCQAGTGGKVAVTPNSVGEVDQSKMKAKGAALDRETKARLAADENYRESRRAAIQAHEDECQRYIDTAARQAAWLRSYSLAARQSAATEIAIQRRKYAEAKCGS